MSCNQTWMAGTSPAMTEQGCQILLSATDTFGPFLMV